MSTLQDMSYQRIRKSDVGRQKKSYNKRMETLRIYGEGLELVVKIYNLTGNNASISKDYSLCDQIRRASISIVANIAEGYSRTGKQWKNYFQIASGSANEVVALLQIVEKVYRIDTQELQESFKVLGRKINAYSKKIQL